MLYSLREITCSQRRRGQHLLDQAIMINHQTFPTELPAALYYDIYNVNKYTDWSQDWETFCEEEFVFWEEHPFAYHFPAGFEELSANSDTMPEAVRQRIEIASRHYQELIYGRRPRGYERPKPAR